jgi:hypothetical protein
MTRKHFIALAAALAAHRPDNGTGRDMRLWREQRDAIADVLYASNGRFDRGRFERATEA